MSIDDRIRSTILLKYSLRHDRSLLWTIRPWYRIAEGGSQWGKLYWDMMLTAEHIHRLVDLLKKGGFDIRLEVEGISEKRFNNCVKFSINPYAKKALVVVLYTNREELISQISILHMRGEDVGEHFFMQNPDQLWGFDVAPFPAQGPLPIVIGHYLSFDGSMHNLGTISHLSSFSGLSYKRAQ